MMRRKGLQRGISGVFLGSLLALFGPDHASAQSPYQSTLRVEGKELSSLHLSQASSHLKKLTNPISVSFAIRGKGRFAGVFDRYQKRPVTETRGEGAVTLLRGRFSERRTGKQQILTGSLYDDGTLNILFEGGGKRKRLYHLRGPLAKGETVLRVQSVPKNIGGNSFCGGKGHATVTTPTPQSNNEGLVGTATSLKVLTIATDADYEYYNRYKGNTNAHIATVINAASAIFEAQMGITLQVKTQHVFTSSGSSPYTSTRSEALLEQFLAYTEEHRHLGDEHNYFLFSGKRWEGNVAGIAFMGVTCLHPEVAYGATRNFSAPYDALVLAHELGHNLGADHDENTVPATLMYPALSSSGQNKFSSKSKNEMSSHLARAPGCFGTVTTTPLPTVTPVAPDPRSPGEGISTKVSASAARDGTFTITITSSETDEGCTLSLLGGTKKTDFSGSTTVLLYSMPLEAERIRFSARIPRRSNEPVYLQSTISCPDTLADSFSSVASLKLSRVNGRRVSAKGWLSLFQRIRWE